MFLAIKQRWDIQENWGLNTNSGERKEVIYSEKPQRSVEPEQGPNLRNFKSGADQGRYGALLVNQSKVRPSPQSKKFHMENI